MAAHVLSLHDLDSGGKSYASEISVPWLLGALEGTSVDPVGEPGRVEVRYSKTSTDVIVKGHATARLSTPCARCLEPTVFEANGELTLLLVPTTGAKAAYAKGKAGAPGSEKREEFTPDDAALDTYEGEKVNLDPFIREALLLEVPPFPLCRDDCQGIGPPPDSTGSAEKPVDPRLAPLLALSAKAKNKPRD